MSSSGLTFSIKLDDAKARAAIRGIYLRTLSLRVPFEALGKWLVKRTHEHFEKQESPAGEPWKALTTPYVDRPKKEGGRGGEKTPILFIHGYLEKSITYVADDTTLAVGTNRKTAAIHQLGGTPGMAPGPAHIPARPYLGMNREDENHGADMMMDYLAGL